MYRYIAVFKASIEQKYTPRHKNFLQPCVRIYHAMFQTNEGPIDFCINASSEKIFHFKKIFVKLYFYLQTSALHR
jgi:hypothetical protein